MVKNIQYRTCFRAKSKYTEDFSTEKLFHKIQLIFWNWIKKKENSCPDFFADKQMRKDFFYKIDRSGLGTQKSTIRSNTAISDEGNAWCFQYTHYDTTVRHRRWIFEAGLRHLKESNDIVVSVTLMHEDLESNVILGVVGEPSAGVPRCIRQVFSIENAYFTFGGGNQRFGFGNILLKPEWTKGIVNLLRSRDRKFPVIVFNGNDAYANKFSCEIAGKAICVTIPESSPDTFQSFINELGNDCTGERFFIPQNGLRVFFPFTKFTRSWEHPFLLHTDDEFQKKRKRLIQLILTNVIPCSDWLVAVEKLSDVVRLQEKANQDLKSRERSIKIEEAHKRLEQLKSKTKNLEEYKELAELYEKDKQELEEENEKLKHQITILAQNAICSYGYNQPDTKNLVIKELPASFEECVKLGNSLFSNLEFSEDAYTSSSEATDGKDAKCVRMLWEMLWHLDSTLFELKFKSGKPVDLTKEFKEKSGYDYAKGEGRTTNADSRLIRKREFFHNEQKFDKIIHIKPQGRKNWRIYFDYDEANRKIVIGHIGNHLDNATTKKRT